MNQKMTDAADDVEDADQQLVEVLWESVLSGAQLKDIRGVPEELMEGIYAYAYDFYKRGRLEDAEVFFRFLCLYDMKNPEYVMGLGAIFQLRKLYQKALDAYALAFALGDNDYRPMFHTGQCNLLLRKAAKARQCFEMVVQSTATPELKFKAQAYLDAIGEVTAESVAQAEKESAEAADVATSILGF